MPRPSASKGVTPNTSSDPGNTLSIEGAPGTDPANLKAQTVLRPSVRAALSTRTFSKAQFGELDITALVRELATQAKAATDGDLQRPEAMLVAQAHTLEAIFHELARRAALNMGEYVDAAETYMRLALKAQSQCRATLETLVAIKQPSSVAFVRQANIAHGPQQVNNTSPTDTCTRARARGNSEIQPNELLEQQRNEWMDGRTPTAPGTSNPSVEAVGAVNRPENGDRQI